MKKGLIIEGMNAEDLMNLFADTVVTAVRTEVKLGLSKPIHEVREYLTAKEAGNIIGVSLPTLSAWEKSGILVPSRIGTRVRYRFADINGIINNRVNKPVTKLKAA